MTVEAVEAVEARAMIFLVLVVARLAEVLVVWLGIIQREEMQQAFTFLTLLMHFAGKFV